MQLRLFRVKRRGQNKKLLVEWTNSFIPTTAGLLISVINLATILAAIL